MVVINVLNMVHRYHLLLPSGPIGHPVQVEGVQPRGNESIPLGNPGQAEQEDRQGSCVQGVLVGFQTMLLIVNPCVTKNAGIINWWTHPFLNELTHYFPSYLPPTLIILPLICLYYHSPARQWPISTGIFAGLRFAVVPSVLYWVSMRSGCLWNNSCFFFAMLWCLFHMVGN